MTVNPYLFFKNKYWLKILYETDPLSICFLGFIFACFILQPAKCMDTDKQHRTLPCSFILFFCLNYAKILKQDVSILLEVL